MRNLLKGANIKLTAVEDSDLATILNWFNDVRFLRYYDMIPAIPKSYRQTETVIKEFETSEEKLIFAIRPLDEEKIIGIIGFDEIIWSNGVATTFIGIGEEGYTGKGLGKEAMKLILDFGFNELNFHRIQLYVISSNTAAIRLYEGLGFIREGNCREFLFRDSKRLDLYLYGMLKPEWDKNSHRE